VGVTKADITKLVIDAIVNAANSSLLGGGGVDGAIHDAAGPELLNECRTLNGCEIGEAKITKAYGIKTVKAIIHTVGPCVRGNLNDSHRYSLSNCYRNSLNLAKENQLRSIAFPCISTGIYHFPKKEATKIALETVKDWINEDEDDSALDKVVFCVFNEEDEKWYKKYGPEIFD